MNKIKIFYHDLELPKIEQIEKGNWIDLRASKIIIKTGNTKREVDLKKEGYLAYGPYAEMMINLGVSMNIGEYEAHLAPRSSTFKKYGLIQTNHVGVIDSSYCGQNDIWHMPCFSLKPGRITYGDRVCQFRLVEPMNKVEFIEVDSLIGEDRGGFGSTGTT